MRGAAPECAGLGWVYYNGHCYLFDRLVGKLVGWLGCLELGWLMVDLGIVDWMVLAWSTSTVIPTLGSLFLLPIFHNILPLSPCFEYYPRS